jgi:uncharacterized membrane protein (Fun14 family)
MFVVPAAVITVITVITLLVGVAFLVLNMIPGVGPVLCGVRRHAMLHDVASSGRFEKLYPP